MQWFIQNLYKWISNSLNQINSEWSSTSVFLWHALNGEFHWQNKNTQINRL